MDEQKKESIKMEILNIVTGAIIGIGLFGILFLYYGGQ